MTPKRRQLSMLRAVSREIENWANWDSQENEYNDTSSYFDETGDLPDEIKYLKFYDR